MPAPSLLKWLAAPALIILVAIAAVLVLSVQPTHASPGETSRVTLDSGGDTDGDGCDDEEEQVGAPSPNPGSTGAYDPLNYWDFYDVPVPANNDPTPNGARNRAVNLHDMVAVLKYVGTFDNGPPNGRVDYDSDKNGDTVEDGRDYDRSPSPSPNPPWDAGPPSGAVNMADVLVMLAQVGLSCAGEPNGPTGPTPTPGGPTPTPVPVLPSNNAMAVDAISGGGVDLSRTVTGGAPFGVGIAITNGSSAYQGYQYQLQWDPSVLAFDGQTNLAPPDFSLCARPTVAENTVYGGCDGPSGTTTFTGTVNTLTFHCLANGASALHLATSLEDLHFATTTFAPGGIAFATGLTDASVTCSPAAPTPTATPTATPTPVPRFLTLPIQEAQHYVDDGWCRWYQPGDCGHGGIDYGTQLDPDHPSYWKLPAGTPIVAAADGWAMASCQPWDSNDENSDDPESCWTKKPSGDKEGYYGNFVLIRHGSNGYSTLYAHLSGFSEIFHGNVCYPPNERWTCEKGVQVKRGEVIGFAGTGATFYPHLHFEAAENKSQTYSGHTANRRDPYDIYGVRDDYPDGDNATSTCGANYLWTACPPIAAPSYTERAGLDSDGDGLPDWYENVHSCLDSSVADGEEDRDGGGLTNLEEYQYAEYGTDPCALPPCQEAPNQLNTCDMQRGDILLSHRLGALYVAQEALFNGYWTHAGIYVGEGLITESSGRIECSPWWQPWTCLSPQPGVETHPILESGFWDATDWAILWPSATVAQRDSAARYAMAQTGKPYNWDYLNKQTEDSFYCSQLAWRAYETQGIDLDSNLSALGTVSRPWLGPWAQIETATGVILAVPPDDLYFDADATVVEQRPGVATWLRRTLLRLLSPGDLYVTDPQGRHTGVDPVTGEVVEEIPGAFYSGAEVEPQFISIEDMSGPWQVQIVGTDTGSYTLLGEDVHIQGHGQPQVEGSIEPGALDSYVSAYAETPEEDLEILPDSDGDGMGDPFEAAHGCLDAGADDSALDPDGDGLPSLTEYRLYSSDPCVADTDADGCADGEEPAGASSPKPGSTGAYDPLNPYDFYDVPIPASNDPTPNGGRNQTVNLQDVVGVLKYVGTSDNGPDNGRVDYDSDKDGDWNGDTVVTEEGDQVGLRYDRSPGPLPSPPYDAGPPDGTVNLQDVVVVLKQVGLSCAGPP